MKKLIIVVCLAAAIGVGAYFYHRSRVAAAAPAESVASTAKVERGPIRLVVSSTGSVVANLDVDIKCKASGEVVKLPFDVSDRVKKGDLLVELDPVDEDRNVKLAQVTLTASKARLAQAKCNLAVAEQQLATETTRAETSIASARARSADAAAKAARMNQLLEKKLISQEDYDTAHTAAVQAAADLANADVRMKELATAKEALELQRQNVVLAETQVESDALALSNAEQRLADTRVVAPMDGVVAARNVQPGAIISSGISNVGGGTAVLTLSDLSRLFVVASVDESDIGKVEVDQRVVITADAYPGKMFPGKVVRVAARGVNASNVVTFEVKIEVLGRQLSLLKPEMTANVEIVAAEKEDALLAPAEAVRRTRGKQVVEVVTPGALPGAAPEVREVTTGITAEDKTEILTGLKEGETVSFHKGEGESRWRRPSGPGAMMMMRGGRGR